MKRPVIALHGGAGVMKGLSAVRQAACREALARALEAGRRVLAEGGSALDAVSAAVVALEDDPLFNAGRGAVYNAAGEHELDASIMDGAGLRAGAVAAVRRIRNPVLAARAVMEKSPHVLLAGRGAEAFARQHGLAFASRSYFHTAERLEALRRRRIGAHGTVGAVALDVRGRLAAATSTGGYTGKLPGRVGDSPVIGAGTWADRACAVSGTGVGEAFLRAAAAHEVAARMRLLGEPLARAAAAALALVKKAGGDGGLVAVDRHGNLAMPFNSHGMFRACIDARGRTTIKIYR